VSVAVASYHRTAPQYPTCVVLAEHMWGSTAVTRLSKTNAPAHAAPVLHIANDDTRPGQPGATTCVTHSPAGVRPVRPRSLFGTHCARSQARPHRARTPHLWFRRRDPPTSQ
jgi:hypothetical protein